MTFNNNYGGMLQAYAIMSYLKKLGHEPIHINVQNLKKEYYKLPYTILKRLFLKHILRRKEIKWIVPEWIFSKKIDKIEENSLSFINKHIEPRTKPIKNNLQFALRVDKNLEAYVIGSDQVWRPSMYRFIDYAFLGFVKNKKSKKIALSPSFGTSEWEFSKEQTQRYKSQLQQFTAISVREKTGVMLCRKYFDVNATHLLDPTILLEKKEYISLIDDKTAVNKKILHVYVLDFSSKIENYVDEICSELNLEACFTKNYKSDDRHSSLNQRKHKSISNWLKAFNDCTYVITDSFHGTIFSIIFNKPFIILANEKRGIARIESLLEIFDLKNRIYTGKHTILDILKLDINWDKVNLIKEQEIEKYKNFLVEALKA